MEKDKVTQDEVMRILVRILHGEHQQIESKIQRVLGPNVKEEEVRAQIKEIWGWDIGQINSILKGFIIAPEFLHYSGFTKGKAVFQGIDHILLNHGSLFEYFKDHVPDDEATVIGKNGIAYSLYLEDLDAATKVLGVDSEETDKLLNRYFFDLDSPGARMKASAAAAVLLRARSELEEKLSKQIDKDILKDAQKKLKLYDNKYYGNCIICKKQTITNYTYTGPIIMFSKDTFQAAEFSLERWDECPTYLSKLAHPKPEYLFGKGVVGILRINKYDQHEGKAIIHRDDEYLIKPMEFGITNKPSRIKQ